jgi:UDP-glucose 4-epimerase
VEAVLLAAHHSTTRFAVYNVATGDYITVKEIAELAVGCVGLNRQQVEFEYTGGNRGWKGDVPIVRLNTDRIRGLGWTCRSGSREALRDSMLAMLPDLQAGQL